MGDMSAPGHGPNYGTRISKEGKAFLLSLVAWLKTHTPLLSTYSYSHYTLAIIAKLTDGGGGGSQFLPQLLYVCSHVFLTCTVHALFSKIAVDKFNGVIFLLIFLNTDLKTMVSFFFKTSENALGMSFVGDNFWKE
jgi:hypothetical protein